MLFKYFCYIPKKHPSDFNFHFVEICITIFFSREWISKKVIENVMSLKIRIFLIRFLQWNIFSGVKYKLIWYKNYLCSSCTMVFGYKHYSCSTCYITSLTKYDDVSVTFRILNNFLQVQFKCVTLVHWRWNLDCFFDFFEKLFLLKRKK